MNETKKKLTCPPPSIFLDLYRLNNYQDPRSHYMHVYEFVLFEREKKKEEEAKAKGNKTNKTHSLTKLSTKNK